MTAHISGTKERETKTENRYQNRLLLPLRTRLLAPQEAKKSLVYIFCLQVDAVFKRNDVDHDGRMSLHDFQAFMEHNQERKNSLKDSSPHHRKHSSGSGGGGGKHS